jgi:hypothetical protein
VAISSRVGNNTQLHHMDGSRVTMWPEKAIHFKVPTVGPDPMGKCRTPVHVGWTSGARSRTPASAARTSGSGPGPLYVGSRLLIVESQDSGAVNNQALLRLMSDADMCPGPAWCGPVRIALLLPAQAETRCCRVATHT